MVHRQIRLLVFAFSLLLAGCSAEQDTESAGATTESRTVQSPQYALFALEADLGGFSDNQRQMLRELIAASKLMDELFWKQAYGEDYAGFLGGIEDPALRSLARINYGPWDRLNGDKPFIDGVAEKSPGARFYPADMSVEEFEAWSEPGKAGLYSLVRRDEEGQLSLVPYHRIYAAELEAAANHLRNAAALAEDAGFANYLRLRAQALVTDDYQPSDLAWLDMKDNSVDIVVGAIESYEDQLFGYRAAYEAYVLVKDRDWSASLSRFAAFLPALQKDLPVDEKYKQETPGTDSDLNAYDVLYYAGHSNAGSKTIAINLPNDEEVQLQKGTRRLQLKNAMRAKFEKILLPISDELIVPEQRQHVSFDAFFANTMFHEVAHGLGIKNTVTDKGTVRAALKDYASSMEEGKADVLGLYMITQLHSQGELGDANLMDNYVTFLASIFRSTRFGASSAHGKANMVRFNFFKEHGAFTRNEAGQYAIDFDAMQAAMNELSSTILRLQGDGDYEGAKRLTDTSGVIDAQLQADLDRLAAAGIPVDITFSQGLNVLGL